VMSIVVYIQYLNDNLIASQSVCLDLIIVPGS
jgi:hypothetical protein